MLNLEITVSKNYQPPNRKLISKDILDVNNDQNMESNLSLIKKESDIFVLLFLGDGATFLQNSTIENIGFRGNIPVSIL